MFEKSFQPNHMLFVFGVMLSYFLKDLYLSEPGLLPEYNQNSPWLNYEACGLHGLIVSYEFDGYELHSPLIRCAHNT